MCFVFVTYYLIFISLELQTENRCDNELTTQSEDNVVVEFRSPIEISSSQEPQPGVSSQCTDSVTPDVNEWAQWTPSLLKKPIHPALDIQEQQTSNNQDKNQKDTGLLEHTILKSSSNITPRKRKFSAQVNTPNKKANQKYELLLDKKIELIDLQINLLKQEHEAKERRSAERHALEMELLRAKFHN